MSLTTEPVTAAARECPSCPYEYETTTMVEPELDGDLRYYECHVCGHEWGWERLEAQQENTCSMGVPEDVRRAASAGMEKAMSGPPVIAGATLRIGPPE
jgi:hypothetical protein